MVLSWALFSTCMPKEIMTDMYYPIHPEGMYQAIKRCGASGTRGFRDRQGCVACKL